MARQGFILLLGVIIVQVISCFGTSCNWNYFQHYEVKGCTAVIGRNNCPVRFKCNKLSARNKNTCSHRGKIYKIGEDIQNLGPCSECSCRTKGDSASIVCAIVECFKWKPDNKMCYMGYKPNVCCPVEMCPFDDEASQKICKHRGKQYKIGNIIDTSDPCNSCICTRDWINENGPGCSPVDCRMENYSDDIRRGCLVIYIKNECCLSKVYCGAIKGPPTISSLFMTNTDKKNHCFYRGEFYKRGSTAVLETDKYTQCKCITPPDFTCLRLFRG